MAYQLEVSHTAHRQIRRLPSLSQERINTAIYSLSRNPRPTGSKKLTAREGYRIRVGDYRVLYIVNDNTKTVTIYRVMARGDAYRF